MTDTILISLVILAVSFLGGYFVAHLRRRPRQ
jgi:hypothetical protein